MEYHFKLAGVSGGREYLLEMSSHFANRTTDGWMNVIDAGWIGTAVEGLDSSKKYFHYGTATSKAFGLKSHIPY
ncbi:hypothetical protein ACJ73_02265, partial [Blastomyces percursus]